MYVSRDRERIHNVKFSKGLPRWPSGKALEEIKALREAHDAFRSSLSSAQADFNQLAELDRQIKSFRVASNPYTWFTMEALEETWRNLQKIIKERELELHADLGFSRAHLGN